MTTEGIDLARDGQLGEEERVRVCRKPNRRNGFGRRVFCVHGQSLLAPSPFVFDMAGVEVDWTRDPSHSVAHPGSPGSQFKATPLHLTVAENG